MIAREETANMEAYLNPALAPEERADALLARMSLEEKMAQIVGLICMPPTTDESENTLRGLVPHGIGQVSGLPLSTFPDAKQVKKAQASLQTMVMEQSEHHIPAVFHNEGLCGASVAGGVTFASGIGRGASFDPELEERIGQITARQELAVGFTQILCPVLDIARDPRHGRHGEAYGEDPTLVSAMGVAQIKGQQSVEVGGLRAGACAKHYMAYHMSAGGINTAHSELGPRSLREIHGKPFQAVISKAGLRTVMPCYNAMDDGPVSSSREMLTTILREEMGLEGTAISDYGAVRNVHVNHHVGETMAQAGYKSLSAGMDVELPSPVGYGEGLKQMFLDGKADVEVLDRAVRRVLTEKFRMGLFENPLGIEEGKLDTVFEDARDREISLASAREGLVLLKNTGILPLSSDIRKIAVIGPQANWANYYFGGYTRMSGLETAAASATSMAGFEENDASNINNAMMIPGTGVQFCETDVFRRILEQAHPGCSTVLQELRKALPRVQIDYAHGYHIAGDNRDEYEEALAICKDADVILLTLGGKNASGTIATTGEGVDTVDINLPQCQEAFIREASRLGIPMVGIHFDGRPISSDAADECLDAILEAWNPGPYGGQAVADVLLGRFNPCGKMPVTTARTAGQIPTYYNHPNGSCWSPRTNVGFDHYVEYPREPRYYFGFGLSYTTFALSNLTINASTRCEQPVSPGEPIVVSCQVTNTGSLRGTEVVQLYFTDPYASMLRPVQELAGFARVELEPGACKTVVFTLSPSQTAFLTEDMRWKVESGLIELKVGHSSAHQPLRSSVQITEDLYLDGRTREFFADVTIQ